jgi:hypothetical protein
MLSLALRSTKADMVEVSHGDVCVCVCV